MTFGPTFGDELIAAGLGGLPFSWCGDGSTHGAEALTPSQQAALQAVIAAHDPTKRPVPQSVTPLQGRLALLSANLLDQATVAVTAAGGAALLTWEYASIWDRNDPLIMQLGAALGLTSSQIDQLFTTASTL